MSAKRLQPVPAAFTKNFIEKIYLLVHELVLVVAARKQMRLLQVRNFNQLGVIFGAVLK